MINKVKTAIIGCGAISKSYIESIQKKFSIIDIAGCFDRNIERCQSTADKYGLNVLSWGQILNDKSIELVINLTSPQSHYSLIKDLLNANKHVYTEKILTIKLNEAEELVELANSKNCRLGSAPDTFLGASIQTAKLAIQSGLIGDVTSCHGVLNRDSALFAEILPFTSKSGGGIGFDVGIYYVTALLSILGPAVEVTGASRTKNTQCRHYFLDKLDEPYEMECETLLSGTILFKNGCIGSLLFDSETIQIEPERPVLTIFGTKGIMYLPDPNKFGGEVKMILKGNSSPFTMQQIHGYKDESRGLGAAELAWAIRKERPHRASKEMAYHALEILHGIVSSGLKKSHSRIYSTFDVPELLPSGYLGEEYLGSSEESALTR